VAAPRRGHSGPLKLRIDCARCGQSLRYENVSPSSSDSSPTPRRAQDGGDTESVIGMSRHLQHPAIRRRTFGQGLPAIPATDIDHGHRAAAHHLSERGHGLPGERRLRQRHGENLHDQHRVFDGRAPPRDQDMDSDPFSNDQITGSSRTTPPVNGLWTSGRQRRRALRLLRFGFSTT